ncbi:2-phosphosulfolactate phosphatase [Diaminobutyricibacter sp. McL0608]|uniref:2-phosphosulfolactate phosphatase n=1 Tax=Leifsonia sp. McL0608 TaxID=3143537 RepID=UPI0031F334F9
MTEPTASEPTASEPTADPFGQAKYQLRFEWGFAGARAVASDADIVVWVDAVGPLSAPAEDQPSVATALAASVAVGAAIIEGGLTNATATARWILDEQVRLGRRAMVSIIAAGEPRSGGGTRFAVEDLLAAGAVIDALGVLGIDYTSPEAAAACASFTGLRGAVAHLLTASASGQAVLAAGSDRATIAAAGRLDTVETVTVLRVAAAQE